MFDLLVPPERTPNLYHAMELAKSTPKPINSYAAPLALKALQHVITDNDI